MKKNHLILIFALVLFAGACRKNEPAPELAPTGTTTELDDLIRAKLESEGRFEWQWASDEQVWTALTNSDHVMSVGYQPEGEQNVRDRIHEININDSRWSAARQSVLNLILESERRLDPDITAESLTAFTEDVLPVVDVYVRNPATITLLRASGLVRYAEPMAYEPTFGAVDRSDSGCGSNTPAGGLTSPADYTNITPDCKQSWNHSYHQINQAWESSTGSGVRVMIIDTGCSPDQDNLGASLNQGNSSGRSISKLVTLPRPSIFGIQYGPAETPDDVCGHGTSMLGACGAPRGEDGAAVGIAYNCNFTSVRATVDVFLNESREVKGVADAFVLAGNTSNVKIISLSLGRLTSASQ
ncbi:MAG: S8/S53 family peptidase, partial [Saprospiraceae bacterium]|nr:S8/S53 family peptidase [Saprospiraceae bacterium]